MTEPYTLPLDDPDATLENVGGKGLNLARLARAGFPVPGGFLVTTSAYEEFVRANDLESWIEKSLAQVGTIELDDLERASDAIRARFAAGKMPAALEGAVRSAYAALDKPPVAVRSSATAEDLPNLSFAGQQDTFLNVIGEGAVLEAVLKCWGSLWTARAIGYRARNNIPHEGLALAVVVQRMVESEASGVLFTANPLTGLRAESAIDAVFGLGEALVSGQVEPDHYVVDHQAGRIVKKELGAKALALHGDRGGGVAPSDRDRGQEQALPDAQILELAELGQRVQAEYGFPQDIEWAWADGRFTVLQSRAITSLYPLPEKIPAEPLKVFFSFGAVQGMLDPMTPLGQDAIRMIFAGGARLFGFYGLNQHTQGVIYRAGERLWGNMTAVIRHPLGRRLGRGFMRYIEPGTGEQLDALWDDPRLRPGGRGWKFSTLRRLAGFMLPTAVKVILALLAPGARRAAVLAQTDRLDSAFQAQAESVRGPDASQADRVALFEALADSFPDLVPLFIPPIAASMASLNLLSHLAPDEDDEAGGGFSGSALAVTRGLPHNVTTEMDLRLWETARQLRADPAARGYFESHSVQESSRAYLDGDLPLAAQGAVADFLEAYGFRGVGEIDIGRPRWRENPAHIIQVLMGYLKLEDENQAPDRVFRRGAESAQAAIEDLVDALRATRLGWLKARLGRAAARRVRALSGLREAPKFYIVRRMGLIRKALLEAGERWVQEGVLKKPEDVFFLYYYELGALAAGKDRDWAALVEGRRADYDREMRRAQVPRLLLSDGRAFYEGLGAAEDDSGTITGSPVSPGVVEGRVRVVLDPTGASLAPGEILVCHGTDPAWTPLFMTAGGLVMEVGGMMTHGSVVAREYGIPAVVGVHQATTRLTTGQHIRMDGSSGRIEILE